MATAAAAATTAVNITGGLQVHGGVIERLIP